ncbi:MAG: hypothetical protein RIR11_2081 [Bacteroidota bacterium]|jgi:hypothetical protein
MRLLLFIIIFSPYSRLWAQGIDPSFSHNAGFYTTTINLILTAPSGYETRYEINGDSVQKDSKLFSTPLIINKTMVVRARTYPLNGGAPSNIITHTFLINETTKLPVVSLTVRRKHLWDVNTGIYADGPNINNCNFYPYPCANYWKGWEKPAYFEYFNPQKQLEVAQNIGIEITGGWSKAQPKKGLLVQFDHNEYGDDKVKNWPLMPEKPHVTTWKNLHLRPGSNGVNQQLGHDAWVQRAARNTNSQYIEYRPCQLFINGEYWGLYELRERQDAHYIKYNYYIDDDSLDMIRFPDSDYYNNAPYKVQAGSDVAWRAMVNNLRAMWSGSDDFYKSLDNYFDLDNYIDYYIYQTYSGNNDWLGPWYNNIRVWRAHQPGSKWRYLLWDMDATFGEQWDTRYSSCFNNINYARHPDAVYGADEHYWIFDKACLNPQFRQRFVTRYVELLNTQLRKDTISEFAYAVKNEINQEMPRNFQRWGGDLGAWQQSFETNLAWIRGRWYCLPRHLDAEFALDHIGILQFKSDPYDVATFSYGNQKDLPYNTEVVALADFETTPLVAYPKPGWVFSHWEANGAQFVGNQSDTIYYVPNNNTILTAYFIQAPDKIPLTNGGVIYPNPSTGKVYIQSELPLGNCTITNTLGQIIQTFEEKSNLKILELHTLPSGLYYFKAEHWTAQKPLVVQQR